MITTAVQGQQTSQMVEIQGAPQPVAIGPGVGSGDDFRTTFAANVASVQAVAADSEATAQPVMSALRSAVASGAANTASNTGALLAKTVLGTGQKATLASLAAMASDKTNSSNAASEGLSLEDTVSNPALSASAELLARKVSTTTSSSDNDSGALPSAASSLKPSSPVVDGSVELSAPNTLRRSILTPGTSGLTLAASGSTGKTATTDHKSEATATKPASTSDTRPTTDQTVAAQASVTVAGLTAAPLVAQANVTVQFDPATAQKADAEKGSPAAGNASGNSLSALAASDTASGTAANASVSSLNFDASPSPSRSATSGMVTGEELEAETTQIATLADSRPLAAASVVPPAPSNKPTAVLPQRTVAAAAIASKNSNAVAESSLLQSPVGQQMSSTQSRAAAVAVAVEGAVAKPVAQPTAKSAAAPQSTTAAKTQPVANGSPSGAVAKPNGLAGLNDSQSKSGQTDNGNPQQSGAVFIPAITASQTPIAVQAAQPVDAPRAMVAATAAVSKDAKSKTSESVTAGASTSLSEAGSASASAPSLLLGSDPAATVKDATASLPVIAAAAAAPVAHVATEAAASLAGHGSGAVPMAATSVGSAASASPAGAVAGTASAHASTSAATSALGSDPSISHQTLLATPTTLEVGVPNGTQGWLKIRAEVGGQGEVNASLTAGSSGAQEMLHSQLPALNAYLHSEQMPVTATVSDRSFSFAGGHPGTGGQPSGSDSTSGSGSSLSHGGAPQSDGSQRQTTQSSASIGDPMRGYGAVVGGNELAAATASQLGVASAVSAENGQWLNVRV